MSFLGEPELAEAIADQHSTMRDTVQVTEVGPVGFDPATGKNLAAGRPVYSGPCRFALDDNPPVGVSDSGDQIRSVATGTLTLPLDEPTALDVTVMTQAVVTQAGGGVVCMVITGVNTHRTFRTAVVCSCTVYSGGGYV